MAQEIKNTFLKSKMNKDLDDRILPNGEYRDALNISVGRSEDSDVGALENIIGNDLITGTDIGNGLTIIGIEAENSTDSLFVFLTDYTDPDPTNPTNAPVLSKHYIYVYNTVSKIYKKLVQGEFLNFSTTNRIIGINIIENLLFWTDNRNQPRKINTSLAVAFDPGGLATSAGDYYTKEHQISVAKYNPYQAIDLYNRADLQIRGGANSTTFEITGHRAAELSSYIGATVICNDTTPLIQGTDYIKVVSISNSFVAPDVTIITVSPAMSAIPLGNDIVSLVTSTMSNKNDDTTWPGDPDFLEDKFARFSYRFKFDDNEYSLMAPFTQIAYIPKQNGYFLYGDEDAAYQSTIVDFMENQVQNIGLVIPLPSSANRLLSEYKITELEVLFRESDSIAAKVLTTIPVGQISASSAEYNYYTYEYQSKKPYRTLPEAQTVRVYDKVPVRALAQESAGNRIIYGNFRDKHTPPASIDYNCKIEPKISTGISNNWIEYPNHSVKKNRNYQVGFVLADKFGRQSPVILSSNDTGVTENGVFYSGSTIYSPYDIVSTDTNPATWFGDAIQVLVNQPIQSEIDLKEGTPGLYAIKQQDESTGEGFAINPQGLAAAGTPPITNSTFTFTLNDDPTTGYPNNINIPKVGDSMRGAYTDFVKVTNRTGPTGSLSEYVVTTEGRVSDVYLRNVDLPSGAPDLKFAYTINDLGWYSYKIVVKQTEQDYYNVYLPGILNGYPGQTNGSTSPEQGPFPTGEENLTAHTVLFNDNINKIPRDLAEVGPDQKQFRSSVTLYGVVTNIMEGVGSVPGTPYNTQYYPRLDYSGKNAVKHTATAIATARELEMSYSLLSDNTGGGGEAHNGNLVFYQIETNPLIARISTTDKSIGWTNNNASSTGTPFNMLPYLAVYETEPTESLLDIYWETSSEGLIVDLNADVASTNGGVAGFQNLVWEFREDTPTNTAVTTAWFSPIDNQGQPFTTPIESASLISVTDRGFATGTGTNIVTDDFSLERGLDGTPQEGEFKIFYRGFGKVFEANSAIRDIYTFTINCVTADGIQSTVQLIGQAGGFGAFENLQPSFNTISAVVTNPTERVILSTATWQAAVPRNGTTLFGSETSELRYSFRALSSGSPLPINTNTGEPAWSMDPNTGELIQDTENYITPEGIYRLELLLEDAASTPPVLEAATGYSSLVAKQNLYVRIEPAHVNTEALSIECVITPEAIPQGGYTNISDTGLVTDPNSNSNIFGGWENYQITDCFYYLTESELPLPWPGQNNENSRDALIAAFVDQGITANIPDDDNEWSFTGANRIGTKSHKSGTICFSINTFSPRNTSQLGQSNTFRIPIVDFYWRYENNFGGGGWRQLPRREWNFPKFLAEQNSVGNENDGNYTVPINGENRVRTEIQSPFNDLPAIISSYRENDPFPNNFYTLNDPAVVIDQGQNPVFIQTVRSFDYQDFPQGSASSGAPANLGIEYAIFVSSQEQIQGRYGPDGMVRTWIQADDLNYPSCVPWLGKNAVTENGAGNLFKYFRSGGSNNSSGYVELATPNLFDAWARSPYGDYVKTFFNNSSDYEAFKPNAYINLRLDRNAIGLASWTTWTRPVNDPGGGIPNPPINEQFQDLQWVAKYDLQGNKKMNPAQVEGVDSIRVLPDYPIDQGISDSGRKIKGTLRIRKTTN
jgi:hypothetical protein